VTRRIAPTGFVSAASAPAAAPRLQTLPIFPSIGALEQPGALSSPPRPLSGENGPLVIGFRGEWPIHRIRPRLVSGQVESSGRHAAALVFPPWNDIDFIAGSPVLCRTISPNLRAAMRMDAGVFVFDESPGQIPFNRRLAAFKPKPGPAVLEIK